MNNKIFGGSACDDILFNFEPCDIIRSSVLTAVEYIVEKPIYGLVDIVNIYIQRINDLIWIIVNYIVQMFSTILSLLNGPIAGINVLTKELKELTKLSLNLLTGDVLSIIIVYTLPLWFYIQTYLFRLMGMVILPFQSVFRRIFSIFGITIQDVPYFTFYHLFLIAKYILIIVYIITIYGFIQFIF